MACNTLESFTGESFTPSCFWGDRDGRPEQLTHAGGMVRNVKEPQGMSWGQKGSGPIPHTSGGHPSRGCFQKGVLAPPAPPDPISALQPAFRGKEGSHAP